MNKICAIAVVIIVSICAGCKHTYRIKPFDNYALQNPTSKLTMPVAIIITQEFASSEYDRDDFITGSFKVPVGDLLVAGCEELAATTFENACVVRQGDSIDGSRNTLVPSVGFMDMSTAAWALDKVTYTIELDWKMTSLDGRVIWGGKADGESAYNAGNVFSHKSEMNKRIRDAIQKVFQESQAMMLTAPEMHEKISPP